MSVARARKEASRRLGIALEQRYRKLAEANGPTEIQTAALELGDCFNTNIEFVINVLKAWGGLEVRFEPMTKPAPAKPANILN
jgi:hypothetical protein